MAGSDTFRGISFQAAYAVGLALDVLEGKGETLVLEGTADVVDAAILGANRVPTLTVQAKTKMEPYSWAPGELSKVLNGWLATSPSQASRLDFVTDGSLGPEVVDYLRPALRRMAEGTLGPEDREYLKEKGLDPTKKALGRAAIKSRLPGGRELLEEATLRFLALHERVGQMQVEEARDVIFRLFSETVLGSGNLEPSSRELSRLRIAELVGIPIETIDRADPWSEEVEERYKDALKEMPLGPAWTLLDMLEAKRPPALAFVKVGTGNGKDTPVPALQLLDLGQHLSLIGAAGSGKTTTLAQIGALAIEHGSLPVSLRLPSYDGRFEPAVARALERVLGAPVAPGVASALLGREDAVILIDGVTELVPDQRRALLEDVRRLASTGAQARFILAGRDAADLSPMTTTVYSLIGLTPESRREIAASLVEDSQQAVLDIEEQIGNLSNNPLLFTMALALRARGIGASNRAQLFDGFLTGLEHREEGKRLDFAERACLEVACYELLAEGHYSAEEWWWIERFSAARQELIEEGTIAEDAPAAEELFLGVKRLGLLQAIPGSPEVGLLHDLFCDWLASGAISRGQRSLHDPVPRNHEEAAAFLAERGPLSDAQTLALAGSIVAASRVADASGAGPINPLLADQVWQRLRKQFGTELARRFDSLRIHCAVASPTLAYLGEGEPTGAVEPLPDSPLSCIPRSPVSSLSLAVDLWFAAIRLELNRRIWEVAPLVPEDATELAAELEKVANKREAAFGSLMEELAPSLIERARELVPGNSILGWVLPSEEYPGVPGTGETIRENKVLYRHTSGLAHFEPVGSEDEIPDLDEAGWMTASGFVREHPSRYAKKRVRTALSLMMRRFDG
jgi:hypothetical protein